MNYFFYLTKKDSALSWRSCAKFPCNISDKDTWLIVVAKPPKLGPFITNGASRNITKYSREKISKAPHKQP